MSWYSEIYTRVREYRAIHPGRGWLLSKCLNIPLIMQFIGLLVSYYMYFGIIIGVFIDSELQAVIYICIYLTLTSMAVWSLVTTISSGVSRVPSHYTVSKDFDEELKSITPLENGKYIVDKSNPEQTRIQKRMVDEEANRLGVVQAECDSANRSKYCYICCHIKPDRTHHCSSCGQCVRRFDHHCPWINHCVSYCNYKPFILYVFYSTSAVIWYIFCSLECVVRYCVRDNFIDDAVPLALILLAALPFGVFSYYPLGELAIYHFGLISLNETTCEQAKPAVLKNDWQADYNMGCWQNFYIVFGWGLWLFPLDTQTEDGLHFKIRYVDTSAARYRRIEVTSPASSPITTGTSSLYSET